MKFLKVYRSSARALFLARKRLSLGGMWAGKKLYTDHEKSGSMLSWVASVTAI